MPSASPTFSGAGVWATAGPARSITPAAIPAKRFILLLLFQLVGNFGDSRIRADFIFVASDCAADPDGSNRDVTHLDRHAATNSNDPFNVGHRRAQRGSPSFRRFQRRRIPRRKRQRRVRLAPAEVNRMRTVALVSQE